MRGKPVLLVLAMICGAITATGAGRLAREADASSPKRTVEILVAARQLSPGASITAERLALVTWTSATAPAGAISSLRSLEGLVPTERIEAGEPVLLERLIEADAFEPQPAQVQDPVSIAEPVDTHEPAETNEPGDVGETVVLPLETGPVGTSRPPATVPAVVPPDYSVVSMVVDEQVGLAYPLRSGDRVNVAAYFPATERSPEASVRELFRGVEVFAVQGDVDRPSAQPIHSAATVAVSLLIPSADVTAWTLASELGKIRLSLTSTTASATAADRGLAADFVRWIEDRQSAQPEVLISLPQPEPAEDRSQRFRMVKLHGDDWTEYEIPAPDQPPVVVGSSRPANRLSTESPAQRRLPEQRPTPTPVGHRAAESSKMLRNHRSE